jgi:hypothetical protein
MSSVIDYIECPHCKHADAWIEIDRWSEHMFCNHCGYTRQTHVTNLDEVGKDGILPQIEVMEENNPLGAYFVQYKDHTAEAGTLHDENSEGFLLQQIEEHRDDIVFVRINSFENNEHKVRYLVGNETKI